MYARVTTTQIKLDKLDEAQNMINDYLEPLLKDVTGFKNALWLIDRKTGKALTISVYETEADMMKLESSEKYLEALDEGAFPAYEIETISKYQEALSKFSKFFAEPPSRETFQLIKQI
ncbi:MAG: hypothetical protein ACE5NW_11450 [Acidiferrobacterales bacterium]